jgi:hypothetical protein
MALISVAIDGDQIVATGEGSSEKVNMPLAPRSRSLRRD